MNHPLHLIEPFDSLWKRPLSFRESAVVALLLLLAGTFYCQLYCLIAFQEMNGAAMPLGLSMMRSAVEVVPALAAFELSKRWISEHAPIPAWTLIAITFLAALAVAVALRIVITIWYPGLGMPIRRMAADRLPALALAAAGVALLQFRTVKNLRGAQSAGRVDELAGMPPPKFIDWIQAAGNYVEIQYRRNRQSIADGALD